MARMPIQKELINTRLASGNGGWIYCAGRGENIGYLRYVTLIILSLPICANAANTAWPRLLLVIGIKQVTPAAGWFC